MNWVLKASLALSASADLRRLALCALLAAFALAYASPRAAAQINAAPGAAEPTAWVQLRAADGRVSNFAVEIADTPEERSLGLMHRPDMAAEAGMLFIFAESRPRSFWMRNTMISLDIIYFDSQGRFVSVQRRARPLDETPLPSAGPAQFVLEINGGLGALIGVGPGMELRSDALEQFGLAAPFE